MWNATGNCRTRYARTPDAETNVIILEMIVSRMLSTYDHHRWIWRSSMFVSDLNRSGSLCQQANEHFMMNRHASARQSMAEAHNNTRNRFHKTFAIRSCAQFVRRVCWRETGPLHAKARPVGPTMDIMATNAWPFPFFINWAFCELFYRQFIAVRYMRVRMLLLVFRIGSPIFQLVPHFWLKHPLALISLLNRQSCCKLPVTVYKSTLATIRF